MKERFYGLLHPLLANIFLYRLFFHFYRSRIGDPVRLPKGTDDLFFDGFPRSGNTYFINLISHVVGDKKLEYSSHLHAIAGLKIALKKKLKPLIIIRHPKDAIASYYFTKSSVDDDLNIRLLKHLTHQYTSYYQYVYKRKAELEIIHFDFAVKNESSLLRDIVKWLKLSDIDESAIETRIMSYKEMMKAKEKDKDIKISALPNKSRSNHTEGTKRQLEETIEYQEALKVYQKIVKDL